MLQVTAFVIFGAFAPSIALAIIIICIACLRTASETDKPNPLRTTVFALDCLLATCTLILAVGDFAPGDAFASRIFLLIICLTAAVFIALNVSFIYAACASRIILYWLLIAASALGILFVACSALFFYECYPGAWNRLFIPGNLAINALTGAPVLALFMLRLAKNPSCENGFGCISLVISFIFWLASIVSYAIEVYDLTYIEQAQESGSELELGMMIVIYAVLSYIGISLYGRTLFLRFADEHIKKEGLPKSDNSLPIWESDRMRKLCASSSGWRRALGFCNVLRDHVEGFYLGRFRAGAGAVLVFLGIIVIRSAFFLQPGS
ncbi:MAG: hypothetical protein LUB61_00210 [Eggerthellaceae bacterium]|nr:hypothetical protein [Eggerthellaceae bacterium]